MKTLPIKLIEFDQHAAAFHLGDLERDMYLALLRAYYGREKPICVNPDDAFALARLCLHLGFDPADKRIMRRMLKERFITLPQWQFHPRLEQDLPRALYPWPHALTMISQQLDLATLERVK